MMSIIIFIFFILLAERVLTFNFNANKLRALKLR